MNKKTLLHEVTGQGEPIVLMPGGLSGWLSWIPHAERLSGERMVVRVQLRSIELAEAGEPFPEDYGVLTEREALHATVNELGLDSFDLAGWSHGGLVSLAFALEYPERVRTLTLIEPGAFWILRETGHASDALAGAEADDRSLSGREITIRDLKDLLVRAGLGRPGDDFESLPQWPVWVRNRQVLSVLGTLWDYTDSLERLRALEIPVLAVKGTDTSELEAAVVDDLVATVPHGRLLELPGGHACHIQNIDRFLEELESHVSETRSNRAFLGQNQSGRRTHMHPNEQLIRTQIDHFIAGNIPGWLEVVSEDLVVHVPPGHQLSGDYRGSQEFVEKFIGRVFELTGGVQLEPHDFFANDDRGIGVYTIRTQRDGVSYEWQHVNVYHFGGGKITEIWWTPFDQAKVAALLA